MANVSSQAVSGAANRQIPPQNIVSGQNSSVGSTNLKPFVPMGMKSEEKVEPQQQVKVDNVALEDAVKKINAFVSPTSSSIQFSVDQESNRTVVKVIDLETKKVIRQFPNEEVLAMSKALDKLQGLMVKQTA
jgi:flagellar protein FlaG